MKKIILLLVLILISFSAMAQSFTLSPNGLMDKEHPENGYVIIEIEGLDAQTLYNKTLQYIKETMKNPGFSLKASTTSEYIRYSISRHNFVKYMYSGIYAMWFTANYDIELRFKDGKIKYQIVDFTLYDSKSNQSLYIKGPLFSYSIYKNNGELRMASERELIEDRFNVELLMFIRSFTNETYDTNNDW